MLISSWYEEFNKCTPRENRSAVNLTKILKPKDLSKVQITWDRQSSEFECLKVWHSKRHWQNKLIFFSQPEV